MTSAWPGAAEEMAPSLVSSGRSVSGGSVATAGAVGVTLPEATDAGEAPPAERATTVTVYAVPASAPMTQLVAPSVVQLAGPGLAVARYPVISTPLATGALHDTLIEE